MPIPEAIAGGLIAGGATVLAAGGTGLATGLMNKKTRQWNERMIKEQRQYNEKLYNQYESPAAQVRQLAAAGYNPYATEASTQAVGNSSSIPAWNPTAMDFSGVAQAGQQIASSYHARKAQERQLEFQQKQLDQVALDSFRQYMLDVAAGVRDQKELDMQLKALQASIESYNASTKAQETMNEMLEEFWKSGGNTYTDTHNLTEAQISKIMQDVSSSLNSMINDNIRLELQIDSSKYDNLLKDINIQNASIVLDDLTRSSNISKLVQENLNIPYSTLPPYLQTMAAGLVLATQKVNTYDYDTVGDYRSAKKLLDTLKSDFEDYYVDYLSNTSMQQSVAAGNVSKQKYFETIIDILK